MVLVKRIKKRNFHSRRKRRIALRKGLSLLPNLFTLGNAFFGFCSIVLAAKGEFFPAAYFIFMGALMDALDGRLARLMGVTSDIGVQLDSLSDSVSFCLAPAVLMYFWQLKKLGVIGLVIAALFLLAGLLRLARFNVIHEQQTIFFIGLPTTIAGCFLMTVFLNLGRSEHNDWLLFFLAALTLILAGLMISSVRFPTFKQKLFNLNKNWYVVAFVVLFAFIAVMQLHQVLLLLFFLYFSSALFVKINPKLKK